MRAVMTDKCGPCNPAETKEYKKRMAEELKNIKVALTYLAKNSGFESFNQQAIGHLFVRFIQLGGELK